MLFQTSIGIDIQDQSISIACLKRSFSGSGFRLTAHATHALGDSQDKSDAFERIRDLLNDFLKENKISPTHSFFCVPRETVIIRYVELPSAVRQNLKESIGYQLDKYVPLPADDICFDCQPLDEGRKSAFTWLLLVAMKESISDRYLSIGKGLNFNLSGIEPRSTAMANFFSNQFGFSEKDAFAFLYFEENRVELGFVKSGFLAYTRQIDKKMAPTSAAQQIREDLLEAEKNSGDIQGRLKVVFVSTESADEWMEPFRESFREVETLELYEESSGKKDFPPPALIPACGAALKGIMEMPIGINLIPEARRSRPGKAGRYMISTLLGLLILLALAWVGGEIVQQRLYVNQLNSELAQLEMEVARIEKVKKEVNRVENQIAFLNNFFSKNVSVLRILKELTTRIPMSAWVQRLELSNGEIRIDGFASSSSDLISLLDASSIFKDVAFVSSISRDKRGNERFRIKLKVD